MILFYSAVYLFAMWASVVKTEQPISETSKLCETYRCECYEKTFEETDLPMVIVDCSMRNVTTLELDEHLPIMVGVADFSRNQLEYLRHNNFLTSVTLRQLDLSRNKISSSQGAFFRNLPSLIKLDLSRNELTNIQSGLFFGIQNLQELDLSFNQLKTLPNKVFLDVPNLKIISLSYNPIGEFLLHEAKLFSRTGLCLNTDIKTIRLEAIEISSFPSTILLEALNISEVYLSDNMLVDIPEVPYSVKLLDISGTAIERISPKQMHYPHLRELIINRAFNLTDIEDYGFFHLEKIEVISLENCIALSYFNELAFGVHKLSADNPNHTLRKLSLARSSVSYLNDSLINFLKNTDTVILDGNPWFCDCHLEWIKQLNLDFDSPYLSCEAPPELQSTLIKNLTKQTCYMEVAISWVKVTIVVLILALVVLVTILVYMGPYGNEKGQVVGVGPTSPYYRITIEPNLAEEN